MKLKIFLASVLNIHFLFWVLYFIPRAGQSWLSPISCILLGIASTRFPCWQFPLAHIHLHILLSFFFGICEIPFFKWIWKVIPWIVPSPQVDKSHSRKLSLSIPTRSKGLQQKDWLWIWEGSLVPLALADLHIKWLSRSIPTILALWLEEWDCQECCLRSAYILISHFIN